MKKSNASNLKKKPRLLLTICAIAFTFGCQSLSLSPKGHMVPEAKRITIPDAGEKTGVYETEDLSLTYKMVKTPGHLNISGKIQIAARVLNSYRNIQYFHLGAILLDAQGKVLDIAPLTTVSRVWTGLVPSDDIFDFSTPITLSGSVQMLAFDYTGRVIDTDGDSEYMNIWEYPVY